MAVAACLPAPHFGFTQSQPYQGLVADECVRAAIYMAVDVDSGGVTVKRAGFGRPFDYLVQYRATVGGLPGVLLVDQRVESDTAGLFLATYLVPRPDTLKLDAARHRRAVDDVLNAVAHACTPLPLEGRDGSAGAKAGRGETR